jgi:hypothetical protein
MCDTSFNAIQISMNELRMEQLVNNSNINLLRDKNERSERAQLLSERFHQHQSLSFQQQIQDLNMQLQQQSLNSQKEFNNLDEQIQRLNKQMFQMQLPKRL